ncbi:unnamed protein product [Periconia digitata]|uniref:Uncharacterized protein n=1 Tax=Periconia digitata TaxID=1303443 RepID=A0A9W4UD39_9PLEO|nr:unnamed protein product [Periconia digitata]
MIKLFSPACQSAKPSITFKSLWANIERFITYCFLAVGFKMSSSMKNFHLTTLDQTMLRMYVRQLLIFQTEDLSSSKDTVRALRKSFLATLRQLPFLAGTSCPASEPAGQLTLKYPEFFSDGLVDERLDVNHSLVDDPSLRFDDLEAEGFSPSKFASDTFCPKLLRDHPGLDDALAEGLVSFKKMNPIPALAAKISFIAGGLILSVYAHHNVTDGAGIASFYRMWSSNSSAVGPNPSINLHPVEIEEMESQRRALDNLAMSSEPAECPEVRYPGTKSSKPALRSVPYDLSAKVIVFSSSTISRLASELSSLAGTRVSSFTTLVTLIWMQITLSRDANLGEKGIKTTKLTMAFDHRKNLKDYVSDTYLGNCATGITASYSVSEMLSAGSTKIAPENLAPIARSVSETLSSTTLDWLKPRLSLFARTPNPHHLGLDVDIFNGPDLFVTSWMHIGTDCEWNIPGVVGHGPKAIRKPKSKTEGNIHILPRLKQSEFEVPFEVMLCLEESEMERMVSRLRDEGWAERIVDA